jgi:hypothetical protein
MSSKDIRSDRKNKTEALKLVRKILTENPSALIFTKHAEDELENDGLSKIDALNVLNSPSARITDEPELDSRSGKWRYRVKTERIVVVIAFFTTNDGLVVITVWAIKK